MFRFSWNLTTITAVFADILEPNPAQTQIENSDREELNSVSVSAVWIVYLCLADFLKSCACSQNNFNRHLVKNLVAVRWIVCQIKNNLYAANTASTVRPTVNSLGNLLQRAPINKNAFPTFSRKLAKLISLHPFCDAQQWVHWQTTIYAGIIADFTVVKFA